MCRELRVDIQRPETTSFGWSVLAIHVVTVFVVLLAFLYPFANALAQVDDIKLKADQAYTNDALDTAIIHYESILAQEYVSAEVYFNLGNAYFRSGNIPLAILNFERALKHAPSDEDIQFNLRLAKLRTVDKIEAVPEIWFIAKMNNLYQLLPLDLWATLIIVMALFSVLCIILYVTTTNVFLKKNGFFGAIVFGVLFLGTFYLAQTSYDHLVNDDRAVVLQPTLTVKSSPDKSGNDLFVVHEGLTVKVVDRTMDWSRIKLPDGNIGWVQSGSLEGI